MTGSTAEETGNRGQSTPAVSQVPETSLTLSVRYAHTPLSLRVSHLGAALWEASDEESLEAGLETNLLLPREGVDLLVEATWPKGTPLTALELTMEPEGKASQSVVVWGEGQLEDVVTFVWEASGA